MTREEAHAVLMNIKAGRFFVIDGLHTLIALLQDVLGEEEFLKWKNRY